MKQKNKDKQTNKNLAEMDAWVCLMGVALKKLFLK